MPIWATEARFSPSKQQFFSDSCRICLCLATDQSATLYSAQRMSEGVAPQGHFFAAEAKRQALRLAFLAKARPVLAVGGLLRRLAREPFRQKRQSALARAAARQESQIGRRDGASGLPPWPSGSDRERLLVALWPVSGGRNSGSVRLKRNDACRVEATVLSELLSYMVGLVANEALGRPGTALKSLHQ